MLRASTKSIYSLPPNIIQRRVFSLGRDETVDLHEEEVSVPLVPEGCFGAKANNRGVCHLSLLREHVLIKWLSSSPS
jgi:hypothetical protein